MSRLRVQVVECQWTCWELQDFCKGLGLERVPVSGKYLRRAGVLQGGRGGSWCLRRGVAPYGYSWLNFFDQWAGVRKIFAVHGSIGIGGAG